MISDTVFMTGHAWLLLALFLAVVLGCAKPLGIYIANIVDSSKAIRFVRSGRKCHLPLVRHSPGQGNGLVALYHRHSAI